MTGWVRRLREFLAVLLLVSVSGCLPSDQSQMEEEKESHYLAGKNCISSMDYKGAIEEFRTALKVNPDSASAHLQLGWLYEEKDPDPAASIYHYEQFLKLRPGYENAEVIRQHINNCKQDLAQTVLPLPVAPGMQHEFEQLAEENKRLREELEKWRLYANRLQTLTNAAGPLAMATRAGPPASTAPPGPILSTSAPSTTGAYPPPGAAATRTCTIKAGDSLYSIARKFGVKLDAILAANPGLDPKRLRVGQTLNLPPP